jgi:DnaJ-class molecular chaperone
MQPTLRVTRGQRLDAEVSITCRGEGDDEIVVANVVVPFRDNIAPCSVCAGNGWIVLGSDAKEECPWCLGVESTAMDEAREIACALYWSWLRSPNGGKE